MSKFKVEFRLLQNMLLNAFNTKLRDDSMKNCHTKLTILFHPTMLNALPVCKLWQYGLWSFQTGGTKLERFLPKNQHTQRKLLNFENWVNGEVSKIGHDFSK